MRLRTKKMEVPKVNEPVSLATGLTLVNCSSPFYSSNIALGTTNINKFKTLGVNFKHSHTSSNLRIEYIVAEGLMVFHLYN